MLVHVSVVSAWTSRQVSLQESLGRRLLPLWVGHVPRRNATVHITQVNNVAGIKMLVGHANVLGLKQESCSRGMAHFHLSRRSASAGQQNKETFDALVTGRPSDHMDAHVEAKRRTGMHVKALRLRCQ